MINTYISVQREWNAGWGFNNTLTLTFTLNGSAFDISSYTFALGIRRIGGGANVLSLTQGSGITNGGATGILTIQITKAQTELIDADSYFYTLNYTKSSLLYSLLHGTFNLLDDYNPDEIDNSISIEANLAGVNLDLTVTVAESSLFLGYYVSLAALQTAYPIAEEGNYAYVDAGVGTDVVTYIWDETDQAWVEGGSGAGGTVTSFSSGNLSPLFTTSVANPTTTPALSFTIAQQSGRKFIASPADGSLGDLTARALVAADIPSNSTAYWKTSGTTLITSQAVIDDSSHGILFHSVSLNFNYPLFFTQDLTTYIGSYKLSTDELVSLIFDLPSAGTVIFDDQRLTPRGIEYAAAGYATTDRSLTDRGYVLGAKTYTGIQTFSLTSLYANNTGIDVVATGGSDILNIGTSNADVINIGYSGSTINITGTLAYQNVTNLQVTDKLFTVNKGGGVGSGVSSGFEIEENNVITGYFATNGTRDGWDFKAPAITGVATLSLASLTGNHTYTLPDANGIFAISASGNIALSAAGNITLTGIVGPANGGTGVANNAASTLTISGNFATTFTVTNTTNVTLPTTGTLVNSAQAFLTASGGTATGTVTFAMGSNPFIMTSSVSTGTGATAAHQLVVNSLTTGNGFDVSSSSVTTGAIQTITSTSTAINHTPGSNGLFEILATGANANASRTMVGISSVAQNTGTTNTNIAGYFEASGASATVTPNIAIQAVGNIQTKGYETTATYNLSLSKYNENTTQSYAVVGNNLWVASNGAIARENTSVSRGQGWVYYTGYSGIPGNNMGWTVFNSGSSTLTHPFMINQSGEIQLIAGGKYGWVTSTTDSRGSIASNIAHSSGTIQIVPTVGVFIGSASAATAKLHLAAGTTTANTAPLQFTSGTFETAARAGVMEYDNTFALTQSDGIRRQVVLATNATKTTAGAPYANDGYITIRIGGTDVKIMTTA